jgi:hypothetical protein
MASRLNMMKLLQELRGLAAVTNRRPQPRLPGPLLLPVRFTRAAAGPTRTIRIAIELLPEVPCPVKITHVTDSSGGAPTLNAPGVH